MSEIIDIAIVIVSRIVDIKNRRYSKSMAFKK